MIDRLRNAARVSEGYSTDRRSATLATSAWLSARGLGPVAGRWEVAIALDAEDRPALPTFDAHVDTRFHISISRDEWGFYFCHGGRVSWIRVTDVPSVFERDEYNLMKKDIPPLRDLGAVVQRLEDEHHVRFHRQHASIKSTIAGADSTIRIWVAASI